MMSDKQGRRYLNESQKESRSTTTAAEDVEEPRNDNENQEGTIDETNFFSLSRGKPLKDFLHFKNEENSGTIGKTEEDI